MVTMVIKEDSNIFLHLKYEISLKTAEELGGQNSLVHSREGPGTVG